MGTPNSTRLRISMELSFDQIVGRGIDRALKDYPCDKISVPLKMAIGRAIREELREFGWKVRPGNFG